MSAESPRRINRLYRSLLGAESYLEIGIESGRTLEQIEMPRCVGVDPQPQFDVRRLPDRIAVHAIGSDDFFSTSESQFDIVFVDGLHEYEQTYRDIINSFSKGSASVVLVDDVVPSDPVSAMRNEEESLRHRRSQGLAGLLWHGDVFRLVRCLSDHHSELNFRTILGSGNPQLLVWKSTPNEKVVPVPKSTLSQYRDDAYSEIFSHGVPDFFEPCGEDEAIARCLRTVSPWIRNT